MPRAQEKDNKPLLSREEWRARRELRREKQRGDTVKRAAKMHAARLKSETGSAASLPQFKDRFLLAARAGVTGNGATQASPQAQGTCARLVSSCD